MLVIKLKKDLQEICIYRLDNHTIYLCMNKSNLYQKFLQLKNEIEIHKWIESEKRGTDIGFETALLDWMSKHRNGWGDSIKEK